MEIGRTLIVDGLLILIFLALLYSFIFLPRQLQFRRTQKYVRDVLRPGEEIVTYGGLIGTVRQVDSDNGVVTLEVAPGVEVRVISASVASSFDPSVIAENARKGL